PQQPPLKKYLDIQRIFEVLNVMIDTTAKAFAEGDVEAARRAHALDNEIDDLYDQIQRELLTYMLADTSAISRASQLAAVARYLERLGDHIEIGRASCRARGWGAGGAARERQRRW